MIGQRKTKEEKPISDSNCCEGMTLSLSLAMCLSTVLFYPPNKYSFHYFPSLLESFFCEAEWPGPLSLTTGLVVGIQCSHQCYPASISGWETKASLQDAAGSGHPRLHWLRLNFQRRGVDLIPGRRTKIPHATWCGQKFF